MSKIERRYAARKDFSNGIISILSSTDKTIEDSCDEAVLLYSEYAKSAGFTLTTENIKQIYDGISRIQGEKYEGIH